MKAQKCGKKYRIEYRHPDIKNPIHESFDTEEEANLRIAQIELDKKLGTFTPPQKYIDGNSPASLLRETMTVAQLMEEYVNRYGLLHWSSGTLSCNRHRIEDYIIPYIGDTKIKDLTTHSLEVYYQGLLTKPAVEMKGRESEGRTVSISVVEKCHAIIRSALNQALRWDYLRGTNPAMAVELPKDKKAKKREVWTAQEAREVLDKCKDFLLKICLYLALGCSMRIGEILGLTWDCVHLDCDEPYLVVEKELRRCDKEDLAKLRASGNDEVIFEFPNFTQRETKTVLVLKTPKTQSSNRVIYIPDAVAEELRGVRIKQANLKEELGDEYMDYNLVIAQNNGRPVETRLVDKALRKFIEENGLRKVVFHSTRHSSASVKLKLSGGDIKAVQGDTGHAQSNMVTDLYSHIMDDDRKVLAKKMDAEFFAAGNGDVTEAAGSDAVQRLIQLVRSSPELAEPLLQMVQLLKKNG